MIVSSGWSALTVPIAGTELFGGVLFDPTMIRRLRCVVRSFLVVALLFGLAEPSRAGDPIYPSGASIGLVPPSGMTPSVAFAGFEHRSGASIVIIEMPPEAYGQLAEKLTPEALRPTGFLVREAGDALPLAHGEGRILRGRQSAHGLSYAKWVALVRDGAGTGVITVQVPEGSDGQVPPEAVEDSLRTITFREAQSLSQQMTGLPYTVGNMAGFRPVKVLAGSSLLLTEGPKDFDADGAQPIVVVASSMGEAPVGTGSETAFARKALGGLQHVKGLEVTQEDRSIRGSAVVVRLRGSGTDVKSGRLVGVTQTILFDGPRYLRIIGTAPAEHAEALARADRVAASIAFR